MPVELVFLTAFLSSVISVLGNKIANSALKTIDDIVKVEQALRELAFKACTVQRNLDELEENDIGELANSTFRPWVQDLTKLCYLVDDMIDDINLEIMRLDQEHRLSVSDNEVVCGSSVVVFSRMLAWLTPLVNWSHPTDGFLSADRFRQQVLPLVKKLKLSEQIKVMQDQLKSISMVVDDAIKRKSPTSNTSRSQLRGGHSGSSYLPPGRMIEKQHITRMLLKMRDRGTSGNHGICIVGMAGLGKTILARSILDDEVIRRKFNVIKWVSTSKGNWNSFGDIIIDIIASRNGYTFTPQKSSSGSGYTSLLVLDDLRNIGLRSWQHLLVTVVQPKTTLVIITTRDPKVAKVTETTLHYLQALSVADSEEMIKNRVAPVLVDYNHDVFQSKVKCIAEKCGGLALVADVIGLALRYECQSEQDFNTAISRYEDDEFWSLDVFLHEILPDLGFDESSLPKNLNKFLAYFALFPLHYIFNKHELSLLWMAEGFINVAPEWTLQPAIDHFESLVSRSMIQLAKCSPKDQNLALSTYQMHVFAHTYAQIVARNTYFRLDEGNGKDILSSHIHHFSSCLQKVEKPILEKIQETNRRLRTFLLLSNYEIAIQPIPYSLFNKLEYLRVLSLSRSDITKLHENISNLKHLRYLDVSYTSITRLPIGLCSLLVLQVLKLKSCPKLFCLPKNFSNLISLIHLELDMPKLRSIPSELGNLTNLQTLPVFIVENMRGHYISELKNMNSLQGSIKITKLENVSNKDEAEEAMLSKKHKIRKLELEWTVRPTLNSNQDPSMAEDILSGLKPSEKLTELRVSNYKGTRFPSWVNSLKNVATIYLYNCPNCNVFPFFGLLGLLKYLKIENMGKIETVRRSRFRGARAQQSEYPTLECLEILNMKRLVKWETLFPGDMPRLQQLRVIGCPQLLSLPIISHLPSWIRPDITDCPRLLYLQG